MAVSPLELLQRQAESAVRREVSRQTAQVRRQLSLVDQVRQMSRRAGEKSTKRIGVFLCQDIQSLRT